MRKKFVYTKETIKGYVKTFASLLAFSVKKLKTLLFGDSFVSTQVVSKKLKIYIVGVIVTFLLAFLRLKMNVDLQNIGWWWLASLGIAVVAYLLSLWALYPVHKRAKTGILLLISAFVFVSSALFGLIFLLDIYSRISYMLVFWGLIAWFWIFLTILLLAVNLLNVNLFSNIPLATMAYTVMKIFVVYMQAVGIFVLYVMALVGLLSFPLKFLALFLPILLAVWLTWVVVYGYITRDFTFSQGAYFASLVVLMFLLITLIFVVFVPINAVIVLIYALIIVVFIESIFEHRAHLV